MNPLIWGLIALATLAGGAVILRERRERGRQKRLVGHLRQSDMYAHLYPLIRKLEQMHVESVAIRREEVRVRLYRPAGKVVRFTFEKHGFDPLEDERILALAQAIGVDMPLLRDRRRYTLIAHDDERDMGGKGLWYEYMIRTDFKDDMSRSAYMRQ